MGVALVTIRSFLLSGGHANVDGVRLAMQSSDAAVAELVRAVNAPYASSRALAGLNAREHDVQKIP